MVCTQIICGRRRRSLGAVTGPIKICRWPWLSGSAGLPWRPTKLPRDAQIDSCLINPSRPTGTRILPAFERGNSDAIWPPPTRDPSHVSCLMSHVSSLIFRVIVSSCLHHSSSGAEGRDVALRCILVARFGLQGFDCLAHRLRRDTDDASKPLLQFKEHCNRTGNSHRAQRQRES